MAIKQNLSYITTDSPLGKIFLVGNDTYLVACLFESQWSKFSAKFQCVLSCSATPTPVLERAAKQLAEYFNHQRFAFDVPLAIGGTEFQRTAWSALMEIPYGETRSYKQQATGINKGKAVRAIGLANSRNLLSIFVPCHRVIGGNGKLTGYAGGLDQKAYILDHERAGCARQTADYLKN